jgi:hypothetical protein
MSQKRAKTAIFTSHFQNVYRYFIPLNPVFCFLLAVWGCFKNLKKNLLDFALGTS